MAKRHQHVVRSVTPVGGPREVKIEDDATRYGLIALSKNLSKLQVRLQTDLNMAKTVADRTFQLTQDQYRLECQQVATDLGMDVTDQSVSIRFDDVKGTFVIVPAQEDGPGPVEALVETLAAEPVEESVEPDAQAEAES